MDDGADRVALVCVRDNQRFGLQVLLREDVAGRAARQPGCLFPEVVSKRATMRWRPWSVVAV